MVLGYPLEFNATRYPFRYQIAAVSTVVKQVQQR